MSLVVGGRDLGSPLDAALAIRDVARFGDYPALFGVLFSDEGSEHPELRVQAARALRDIGHKLAPSTRAFLTRVSSKT